MRLTCGRMLPPGAVERAHRAHSSNLGRTDDFTVHIVGQDRHAQVSAQTMADVVANTQVQQEV